MNSNPLTCRLLSVVVAIVALGAAARAMAVPTVYIAGDSTVMTYKSGYNLLPQEGAWTNWMSVNVGITLTNGTANTIQLKSNGQDLANVDEITVL